MKNVPRIAAMFIRLAREGNASEAVWKVVRELEDLEQSIYAGESKLKRQHEKHDYLSKEIKKLLK